MSFARRQVTSVCKSGREMRPILLTKAGCDVYGFFKSTNHLTLRPAVSYQTFVSYS